MTEEVRNLKAVSSRGSIWAWRAAGLALALMAGFAARRLTASRLAEPAVVAPEPGAGGSPTPSSPTTDNGLRTTDYGLQTTDHGPRTTQDALVAPESKETETPSVAPSPLALAYETGRTEPGHALELAADLPPGHERDNLITHLVSEWAAKTPEVAASWANQLADPALRSRVAAGVAAAWAESDPGAAAAWAIKSLDPGKLHDDAIMSVVQRWTQQKPEEAAAWIMEFPAGGLQNTAVEELVKLWTDQNFEAAGRWLGGLGHGLVRDTAVGAYVNKIVLEFPESAARWAKDIQDDALRSRELETIGELWLAINPAAARVWISQADLTETAKARLASLGLADNR